MQGPASVLIVGGIREQRDELVASIGSSGVLAVCCSSVENAQSLVRSHQFGMILCDGTAVSVDLRTVVRQVSSSKRKMPVVIISDRDDWGFYLATLRAGAFDCVSYRTAPDELARVVRAALRESGSAAF
jgi:DNA-binding NtrC family response regulator